MDSKKMLSPSTVEFMQEKIVKADSNEVFFAGSFNEEKNAVESVRVIGRGNEKMAPAVTSQLEPGECVIHNHPSGDLRPSAADIKIASRMGDRGIGFIIIDNEVSEAYVVVEPAAVATREELSEDKLCSHLQKGSSLEKILPGFQERKEQLKVLSRAISAFNEREKVLIEAGTGVGKSFAYLLPAIYWSQLNGDTVVVSTNTINLQQQLIEKDIIQLKKILPFDFQAVLVKGRSNYVCLRRVKQMISSGSEEEEGEKEEEKESRAEKVAEYIDSLAKESEDFGGSFSDLDLSLSREIRSQLKSESDLCLGSSCHYFENCYFHKAREQLHRSDILVVNHHLLLSDVVLKGVQAGIMPRFDKLVVDEAHNLSEAAHNISGQEFYPPELLRTLKRLRNSRGSPLVRLRNMEVEISANLKGEIYPLIDNKIWPLCRRIEESLNQYGRELLKLLSEDEHRLRLEAGVLNEEDKNSWQEAGFGLLEKLDELHNYLSRAIDLLQAAEDEERPGQKGIMGEIVGYADRIKNFFNSLEINLDFKSHSDDFVFWLQRENHRSIYQIRQKNSRIEVDEFLNEVLYSRLTTLVLTSATLATSGDFSYFKSKLGLENASELQLSSPFDYKNQVKVYASRDLPPVNDSDFVAKISPYLADFLRESQGGSLLLFTSYKMLNETRYELKTKIKDKGPELLVQGESSRRKILERMKRKDRSILLGTASFWEGIDVPGDSLSNLVIMRLPFSVPTDPLFAARQERVEERGGSPFMEVALPRAIIRFKQGFGRLIRSRDDTGNILIMDRRILARRYGQHFLDSLPDGCEVNDGLP
ncbi:helicase C-terminal domain-containing protein [Halarsenatibacter silvermanii]|uniref:DNA 5'-3' helicase n=1 Tax=Halarsenatibacter silvermanii TaxID=321763 RepID=A0A1G9LIF0_9FIRM|nr:helicase C-terminal domain-containing protein [Halarsenatibacter silvermanii]SDL61686.1 ATP-dependent DNA helicase DinG [Halarsenatibacter silvermanii]